MEVPQEDEREFLRREVRRCRLNRSVYKATETKCLNLRHVEVRSKFALNFNLRCYSEVDGWLAEEERERAAALVGALHVEIA